MGDRRRALRVPVRGVAVFHADGVATSGPIENLSSSGALVAIPLATQVEGVLELKLGTVGPGVGGGRVNARTVRVEPGRVAVELVDVDPNMRATIDAAIAYALHAAERRPVLVLDERTRRRHRLVSLLASRGMTPFAPSTPLEAIDLLTRSHLHVNVALVASSFGQSADDLHELVSHSFPWVKAADISDDLEATADVAERAWRAVAIA